MSETLVPKFIKQEGYELGIKKAIEEILGERLKTQMSADMSRGDGTGNVDLTSVEFEAIFIRILNKLKSLAGTEEKR